VHGPISRIIAFLRASRQGNSRKRSDNNQILHRILPLFGSDEVSLLPSVECEVGRCAINKAYRAIDNYTAVRLRPKNALESQIGGR
jgi:hypothetical protein